MSWLIPGGPAQGVETVGAGVEKLCLCAVRAWCGYLALQSVVIPHNFDARCIKWFLCWKESQKSISSLHSQSMKQQLRGCWKYSGWFTQLIFLPGSYVSQCSEGLFFYTNEIKNWKSPQARSDPCNEGNVAMKDIYAKEVIVDLVTIISHLV